MENTCFLRVHPAQHSEEKQKTKLGASADAARTATGCCPTRAPSTCQTKRFSDHAKAKQRITKTIEEKLAICERETANDHVPNHAKTQVLLQQS